MKDVRPQTRRRKPRKDGTTGTCCCCKQPQRFVWSCRCGFDICQACMNENAWGMTCNNITWVCPDCGESNGFGNQ